MKMNQIIVITNDEYKKGKKIFNNAKKEFKIIISDDDEKTLASIIKKEKARAVIVGVATYTGPLYEAMSKGGIIARFGVGHDGINKVRAKAGNIYVTNTQGVLDASVAEYTIWLLGCLARHILHYHNSMIEAKDFHCAAGMQVEGKNLGLIGFGRIAKRVAKIASQGLGMKVHAFDIVTAKDIMHIYGVNLEQFRKRFFIESYSNKLSEILKMSDFVSIHLPCNDKTFHFISQKTLTLFKKGAYFINTARGKLVNESELYDALTNAALSGAALDVFEKEPYEPINPDKDLTKLNNVILTPHIASNSVEANNNMAKISLRNIIHYFSGKFNLMDIIM